MSTVFDAQRSQFSQDPDDRRTFEALEEHYFLGGAWDELARLYRERIEAPSVAADPTLQSPLLFRLGQILEERTLDTAGATEVYWRLAKLDSANRPALRQLRGIYEQREQWDMVLQIAEIESQTEMPAYERAAFESELGRYWKEHLGDAGEARGAFERALEADSLCPEALEGLAQLHIEGGRERDAAELLETLAGRLRGPERAPVWTALGKLYVGSLGERRRAGDCFRKALEDDPFMMSAVEWSLLLETEFENWPAVGELLERRFDLAAGARHRAAIAVEASQLQLSQLHSAAAARAWINRACELAADEPTVLLARADVDRAEDDLEALGLTLDELRAELGSKTPRPLLLESARLHLENGEHETALELVRMASEKPGTDDAAFLMLQADLFRASGAKQELAEILETLHATGAYDDDPKRVESLRELAQIQEQDLADEDGARISWQRAFELDPMDDVVLDALTRLHQKRDDTAALEATYRQAIEARGAAAGPALRVKLAQLQLESEDHWDSARRGFEAVLEDDASNVAALAGLRTLAEKSDDSDLLIEVCEREFEQLDDTDQRDPARIGELAETCIPRLEQADRIDAALVWTQRWHDVAPGTLDALTWKAGFEQRLGRAEAELESLGELEKLQRGSVRAATLRRKSELQHDAGDFLAAATALEESLREEPNHLESLERLAQYHRDLDRPERLIGTLRSLADALPLREQEPVLEELASILHDSLGDLDAAIVVRGRILDLPDAPEEAAAALEALLEKAGRHAELVQRLELRRAGMAGDDDQALALDLRRSELLLDALGQSDAAAAILKPLLDERPHDPEIQELLERALRESDDTRALCDLLERKEAGETDPNRLTSLRFERAGLLEQVLGEPIAACDLYEELARDESASGRAPIARARLEAILEAEGEWARLRDLLVDRLGDLDEHQRRAHRLRIATICRDRLDDLEGCTEQLEAIAESGSVDLSVWQQLEEIYRVHLDRPADWLRVMQAEVEAGTPESRELALRIAAARLLGDDERRPTNRVASEAMGHFERVLELDPRHVEAAHALADSYQEAGRPEDTRRILEMRLEQLPDEDRDEASALRIRLGRLLADDLDDREAAISHFEAADEADRLSPAIAESLALLYEQEERFEALVALSEKKIERTRPGDESVLWRLRHARSARRVGDLELAAASYRVALETDSTDRELEDELISLYEEKNDFESLAPLLTRRAEQAGTDEGISVRLRLAEILSEHLEDGAGALDRLEEILASRPDHPGAFVRALDLATRLGDRSRLRQILDLGLERAQAPSERARLLERRGRLLAERFGDPEAALVDLREAMNLDPERAETRQLFREQLEALERWPAVLDCLYLEFASDSAADRAAICERAAGIAETRIAPDAALPWLTRLREERPEDPELLSRIGELHLRARRFEASLRVLDQEIALRQRLAIENPDAAMPVAALQIRRAELLERELASPARAVIAYQEAIEAGPPEELEDSILAELDRLYASLDRPIERARILEKRVAKRPGLVGVEMRTVLAGLYNGELAKPERAIAPLLQNIEALRQDPLAEMNQITALDRALRGRGPSEAWARMAERALELIRNHDEVREHTSADDLAYLQEELARVYDEDLGQPLLAIAHLRSADDSAGDPELRDQRLRQLLRRTDRPAELARRIQRRLDAGEAQGNDALELGQLYEERLQDLEAALSAYRHASADPDVALEGIRGMRRCAERLRDWETYATALELESRQGDRLSTFERAAAARKLGETCWQRFQSSERAAEAYRHAIDLDPKDLGAVRALASIRAASNDYEETRALYRRELELLGGRPAEQARARELWLALAENLQQTPDREVETLEAYRQAALIERLAARDELRMARLHDTLGQADPFCELFAAWCDREDSAAQATDHLELADRLADKGRSEEARQRALRATEVAPKSAAAWVALARLERAAGDRTAAAQAFLEAADHADPREGSKYCIEASLCLEVESLTEACDALSRAVELDPSSLVGYTALARGSAAINDDDRAWRAADRALELALLGETPDETRREIALLGGRAAQRCDERAAARRLFSAVLSVDPHAIEALEAIAHADFEAGDFHTARVHLETRIELDEEDCREGLHLAMIARGLEADHLLDAAWARYEAALEVEPTLAAAYEGLARVHERSGRIEQAMATLEAWSEHGRDKEARAAAALRAAEHALELERPEQAQRSLERATTLSPGTTRAWELLSALVEESGSESEARAVCEAALIAVPPSIEAASIALRSARIAESNGDPMLARERFADACRWDPTCIDGALGEARLVRGAGDWRAAEGSLERFLASHPAPNSERLAVVHLERGRLLSGPLEDFDAAIDAYGRALELQPDLNAARTALAGLLVHAPERWREALELNRVALQSEPTHAPSLRALGQIATQRGDTEIEQGVQAILDALGHTPRHEPTRRSTRIPFATKSGPPMIDVAFERLRRIAHLLREDADDVLGDIETPELEVRDSEVAEVVGEILRIEGELAAPGIGLLGAEDRRDFFSATAGLLLDPGGNGGHPRYREALDRALGRWSRRKLRRIVEETSLEAIESLDHGAWGDDLRAMAAASLLDRGGRSLAIVLQAMLVLERPEKDPAALETANLETLVMETGATRCLLARLTTLLCDRLAQGR